MVHTKVGLNCEKIRPSTDGFDFYISLMEFCKEDITEIIELLWHKNPEMILLNQDRLLANIEMIMSNILELKEANEELMKELLLKGG